MKKNWLQIITLCLCAALLIVVISQGRRLDQYQRQTKSSIDNLKQTVENEMYLVSDRIQNELEEANRVVAQYALEPTGIDKGNKALTTDVSVTLKEWYADTEITVLATIDGKKVSLPATADGAGSFVAQLSIPLEGNPEVLLDALITGGGLTKQETLSAWGEISLLLPLRQDGGGWSGPDYRDGVLYSQFTTTITGQDGIPVSIHNPVFQIYKNGELAQTIAAIVDPYMSASNGACYTVDSADGDWGIACDVGDVIDIRFLCEDQYGLGYDFLFATWPVQGETPENSASAGGQFGSSSDLKLYWPE